MSASHGQRVTFAAGNTTSHLHHLLGQHFATLNNTVSWAVHCSRYHSISTVALIAMANPRLPFLYPNLRRAFRSCEPMTYRSLRISNGSCATNARAAFHSSRRRDQETYQRRYGPAVEPGLPPPSRPKKGSTKQQQPTTGSTAAGNESNTNTSSSSGQKSSATSSEEHPSQRSDAATNGEQKPGTAKSQSNADAKDAKSEASDRQERGQQQHDGSELDAAAVGATPSDDMTHVPIAPTGLLGDTGHNPLEDVLQMPAPAESVHPPGTTHHNRKPPHLSPSPYVHHFDTYSLVRDLSKGGFTEDQSITIMKAVRAILHDNLDLAQEILTSKSDVENESYLFKAACSELQSSLQTARNAEIQRQRASRTHLQHEADIISQRLNQELAGLKDDIKGMFNDHKMTTREMQRSIDTSVQELNYKITVSLTSDGKSEIEGLRWVLTRRAALAVATSACKFDGDFSGHIQRYRDVHATNSVALFGQL